MDEDFRLSEQTKRDRLVSLTYCLSEACHIRCCWASQATTARCRDGKRETAIFMEALGYVPGEIDEDGNVIIAHHNDDDNESVTLRPQGGKERQICGWRAF